LMTFVINEGPRYEVSSVSFEGNSRFSSEELARKLQLESGEFFRRADMQSDLAAIRDTYGAVGHIFADVNADITFHEEPGRLDLVYTIEEGKPYRVGRIEAEILGDNPHTRITTVLNRLSFSPGDLIDIRELRASERRLKASQLFEVDPMGGLAPQIVVVPPELEDMETSVAGQPEEKPRYRGQSPGPTPHTTFRPPDAPNPSAAEGVLDVCVRGRFVRDPQPVRPSEEEANPDVGQPQPGFGPPDVIRGQYSADAGRTVPSLRQPGPRLDPQPSPQFGGYLPPAETSPEPTYPQPTYPQPSFPQSTYPQSTYPQATGPQTAYPQSTYPQQPAYSPPLGSAPYSQPLPSAGPQPGGSAPLSPTYGSQFGPAPQIGLPGGGGLAGPLSAGGSIFDDGYGLSGNPPYEDPPLYLPVNPRVHETRTGRLMFSAGVNSDAGLLGSVILDEQNFDWTRLPTSWEDVRNGTAWRGAGQRFRLEAVPGTQVQKYTANFTEPYLLDTPVSLGLSGYYYSRWYREWDEDRVGGRVAAGYQFTHDLSGTLAFRGAKIQVFDPITPTPAELTEVLGSNALYGFSAQLTHDTRDNAFLATEGHLFEASVEQVIGSFDYTRGDIDFRKYFMLRQHPDGSGRHVMSLGARAAVTSDDTPIYEHYYAGGFSTLRGFDFRGASTRDPNGVIVGGHFMMLASVEYLFPITADGNLRAVVFCDTGAVQPRIDEWTDKYRVSPGVGLRIVIPAMGAAPIALDFAFPVSSEPTDQEEVFSFFVGFLR
ncbi:MAG: BamA/TamA family outer membrane protein, partial [Planctomycetota bacterium]